MQSGCWMRLRGRVVFSLPSSGESDLGSFDTDIAAGWRAGTRYTLERTRKPAGQPLKGLSDHETLILLYRRGCHEAHHPRAAGLSIRWQSEYYHDHAGRAVLLRICNGSLAEDLFMAQI
jgi:hypothetical protein